MTEVALRWVQHHSALNMRAKGGNDGAFGASPFLISIHRSADLLFLRYQSGIVIGASSLAQLQQNLDYFANGPLPEGIVEACEKAWQEMAGIRPPYYHGEYKYEYDTIEALYGEGAK